MGKELQVWHSTKKRWELYLIIRNEEEHKAAIGKCKREPERFRIMRSTRV